MAALDPIDFDERAAIAEFDGGLTRADAERLALGEILDVRLAEPPDGILGEVFVANRRRHHADLQDTLAGLGLVGCRAPTWGVGWVVPEGRTYRPAARGELGKAAIIVPSAADGALVDLVSQSLGSGKLRTRLDVAAVVGADEIEQAKIAGRPLLVFDTLTTWLRAGCRGAVVVDWHRAGAELDGVRAILTPQRLAQRLHNATARCWPRPMVAVPDGGRHAA
jgi:hypothetical protein